MTTARSIRHSVAAVGVAVAMAAATLTTIPLSAASPASTTPGLPTYYAKKVIGYSVRHRPIVAYHLGTPGAKKAVLLGQMHGDEHVGIRIVRELLADGPIKGIDLWVIPTMNPDGNAANTRQNAHGVDLNRNFPHHWAHLRGRYVSGTRALSEPESRAMARFLSSFKPALMVSIHQPLDAIDSSGSGARLVAFRKKLAARLGIPLRPLVCPASGGCFGSMTSWLMATQKGIAITVEFPAHPSAAKVKRAPAAILSAFGGSRDTAAAHNPRMSAPSATSSGSTVTVAGWAWDPDAPGQSLAVTVAEGSETVASGTTSELDAEVNKAHELSGTHGYSLSFTAADGTHTYCVTVTNAKWGSADPHSCTTVTVESEPSAPPTS